MEVNLISTAQHLHYLCMLTSLIQSISLMSGSTGHVILLHNGSETQIFISWNTSFFFFSISFQAIKSRLWPKSIVNKKSKDEPAQVEKTVKASASPSVSAAPPLTAAEKMRQSPFDRAVYDMAHNEKVVNELTLGRRVGFYELRGEIGQGNFSTVRLGIHVLTKGQGSFIVLWFSVTQKITNCLVIWCLKHLKTILSKIEHILLYPVQTPTVATF